MLLVTILSLAVALVMTGVAWRLSRQERRRSEARVAALAADLYDDDNPAPVEVNDLFAPDARPRTKGSFVNALAIGVLVVGSLMAMAVVFTGRPSARPDEPLARDTGGEGAVTNVVEQQNLPLELTALGHDRQRNELSVRGIVRNPSGSAQVGPLMAAVSVFNRQGDLVASGRAPIERASLEAGVESRFVVRIADAVDVYRYRVSFTVDNRAVAHVDRRDRTATVQLP